MEEKKEIYTMTDNITQFLPILFMLVLVAFIIFIVFFLSGHFNRSKRIEEKLDKALKEIAEKKEK
jgi:uncharacterized membrane protein